MNINIKQIYEHVKENYGTDSNTEDLLSKYRYYISDIDCYGLFYNDRSCSICKAIKPLFHQNCKKDNEIWEFLGEFVSKDQYTHYIYTL